MLKSKLLMLFFFGFSSIMVQGQEEVDIYNEAIDISQEDLKDALDFIGLEIFNFKMHIPKDGTYNLVFYIEEYVKNELISTKDVSIKRTPYQAFVNEKLVSKDLEKIRIIINKFNADTSSFSFETQISGGRGQRKFTTEINKNFERKFDIRPFKLEKPKIGKANPLLLVGSFWSNIRNGEKEYSFCTYKTIPTNFTDEPFTEMPSHYIIGYKLVKLEY